MSFLCLFGHGMANTDRGMEGSALAVDVPQGMDARTERLLYWLMVASWPPYRETDTPVPCEFTSQGFGSASFGRGRSMITAVSVWSCVTPLTP